MSIGSKQQNEQEKRQKPMKPSSHGVAAEITLRNLYDECGILNSVTPSLTEDNRLYCMFRLLLKDKAAGFMPYVIEDEVFHLDNSYFMDFSGFLLETQPFNAVDGMTLTAAEMYKMTGFPFPENCKTRVLTQSYFLMTALCAGLSSNGSVKLFTKNKSVIQALPKRKADYSNIKKYVDLTKDNLSTGKITCVELVNCENGAGYELKPAAVDLVHKDFIVLPKMFIDDFIYYVYDFVHHNDCKISYVEKNGTLAEFRVLKQQRRTDIKNRTAWNYVNSTASKYGFLRFVTEKNTIVGFPLQALIGIEKL